VARSLSQQLLHYLVDWRDSPWPIDWESLFGRNAPLSLEIGFGNGTFLAGQARSRPDRNHIGIELSWSAATRLFQRLEKAGVENARVLLIDAEAALQHLFLPESLTEVFANHPCPWPKARHGERRLFASPFLDLLTSRMRLGSRLTVVTDHAEYAQWLGEMLEGHPALTSCHPGIEAPELPGRQPTKYQRKAMAEGIPIHYFEWTKQAEPEGLIAPAHRDQVDGAGSRDARTWYDSMPTISLRGDYDRKLLLADFQPLTLRETVDNIEIAVRLSGAFRREEPPMWLVECFVSEGKLRQEFAIMVIERKANELFLKLSGLGRPHPTFGVKLAIAGLGRVLMENDPKLTIVHENLGAEALATARKSEVPC